MSPFAYQRRLLSRDEPSTGLKCGIQLQKTEKKAARESAFFPLFQKNE